MGRLTARFLPHGLKIFLMGYSNPGSSNVFDMFVMHLSRQNVKLNDLELLRGLVVINTPQSALDFVRLRTSLQTGYIMVMPKPIEREIMPIDELVKASNYGLSGGFAPFYESDDEYGCNGIIRQRDFARLGFHHPIIRRTRYGFVIERWTLAERLDVNRRIRGWYTVNKIRETIGEDGMYCRSELSQSVPPATEGIFWTIPPLA